MNANPALVVSGILLVALALAVGTTLVARADRRRRAAANRLAAERRETDAWSTLLEQAALDMSLPLSEPDDETAVARHGVLVILSTDLREGQPLAIRFREFAQSQGVDVGAIQQRAEDDVTVARLRNELDSHRRTLRDTAAAPEARLTALEAILSSLNPQKPDIVARVLRDYQVSSTEGRSLNELRQYYLDLRSEYLESLLAQGKNAVDDAALGLNLAQLIELLRRGRYGLERLTLSDDQLVQYYVLLARLPVRNSSQIIEFERLVESAMLAQAAGAQVDGDLVIAYRVVALHILGTRQPADLMMDAATHTRQLNQLRTILSEERVVWLEACQGQTPATE